MKVNPHQRSRATTVQATADFLVQMHWAALKHMLPSASGDQYAYMANRQDPSRQGCVYIITIIKKDEVKNKVALDILSDKDKRPNVQIMLAHNGAVTVTYGGEWPTLQNGGPVPSLGVFKITEGDTASYIRFRDELQKSAMRLLSIAHGGLAGPMYHLCMTARRLEFERDQAREQIAFMEKTGIVKGRVANQTAAQNLMSVGLSGTATASFGGLVRVHIGPSVQSVIKSKREPEQP